MRRRLLRLTLFALLLILLMFSGMGVFFYHAFMQVGRCGQAEQPNFSQTPANFVIAGRDVSRYQMPTYNDVRFPSRGSTLQISAWYVPPPTPDASMIILSHGVSGCKHIAEILLPAGMLYRAGFGVLMLDLRNHGDSERDNGIHAAATKEYLDILGAWDWLTAQKNIAPERVGLYGQSMGAASVMNAAGVESRIAAVWADSPFCSAGEYFDHLLDNQPELRSLAGLSIFMGRIAYGDNPVYSEHQPINALAQFGTRPLFILHGSIDKIIPIMQFDQLVAEAQRLKLPMESWRVEGSEHIAAVFDQSAEYESRLITFFNRTLRK